MDDPYYTAWYTEESVFTSKRRAIQECICRHLTTDTRVYVAQVFNAVKQQGKIVVVGEPFLEARL